MDASLARSQWSARAALARLGAWAVRHPLALCLPVQAVLLLTDLGRLPLWGDEQASLERAAMPFDALVRALRHNVHPTLYFATLRAWLSFPCSGDTVVCARALSALLVIATTLVIDRFWLTRLDPKTRTWFLILWALSPALLLYGRMARSYSMQLLLAVLTLEAGRRYAAHRSGARLIAYAAAAIALLYTHYLPAIAVIASVTAVMLVRQMRQRDAWGIAAALAPLAIIAVALAEWLPMFIAALDRVGTATRYRLLGGVWLDAAAALAFTFISFTIGEAVQVWMIVALALLVIPIAALLLNGVRELPPWLTFVAPAALIAFLGAHQWVSYAFVAARVLFLLPFFLLLLIGGGRRLPRLRALVGVALCVLSLAGIRAYFNQSGFLNKAYVIPIAQIGNAIRDASGGAAALIIIDHHSCNLSVDAGDAQTLQLHDQQSFDAVVRQSRAHVGPVWFVRGTHDVSAAGWNRRVEDALATDFEIRRTGFAPYSGLDHWLMGVAGWRERPTHAVELLELRRHQPGS